MNAKKLLAVLLSGAMALSTMSLSAFANDVTNEAKIGDTEYATLEEAFDAANASEGADVIELLTDVVIEGSISVPNSSEITILGNGKTIGLGYVNDSSYGQFSVEGTLNLGVNGGEKNALTITSANAEKKGMHWFNIYSGTINMYDGAVITGIIDMGSNSPGAPIFLYNGNFNMYGGEISDCKDDGGGYFTFAGAIFMEGQSTFNMYGGKISENSAKFGGALYMNSGKAVFNMYDGEITNNHATEGGAALGSSGRSTDYHQFGGGFNIYGGVISGNAADEGGAIDIGQGVLKMEAGEVRNNTTQNGLSFTKSDGGTISISGGVFDEDLPEEFIADGYYYDSVAKAIRLLSYKVIDTAKSSSVTVTLADDMLDNIETAMGKEADPEEVATYMVKLDTPSQNAIAIAPEAAEGKDLEIIDISVVKVVDDTETEIPVKNQNVTIKLENAKTGTTVNVYHLADDADDFVLAAENLTVADDYTINFTAPSFSVYAFEYVAEDLTSEDVTATDLEVKFYPTNAPVVPELGSASIYDIVIASKDSAKKINRLTAADLTFTNDNPDVVYTIEAAPKVSLTTEGNRYMFNFDGVSTPDATGTEILIGKLYLDGYGEGKIGIDATVNTNLVNATLVKDNIVRYYTPNGLVATDPKTGNLDIAAEIDYNIVVPQKELTVEITFNNTINDNMSAYQDMKVTITGPDLSTPVVKILGTDEEKFDYPNQYVVSAPLTLNNTYTVTVSGAGYRTAKYVVTMTENKKVCFWNNVKTTEAPMEIGKEGNTKGNAVKNFLAGDIVKDNNINIYDLSAVVSYFGETMAVDAVNKYTKYDLNRDGKIDSKDVAYVLVSWNN